MIFIMIFYYFGVDIEDLVIKKEDPSSSDELILIEPPYQSVIGMYSLWNWTTIKFRILKLSWNPTCDRWTNYMWIKYNSLFKGGIWKGILFIDKEGGNLKEFQQSVLNTICFITCITKVSQCVHIYNKPSSMLPLV